jgi:hypothetical protein
MAHQRSQLRVQGGVALEPQRELPASPHYRTLMWQLKGASVNVEMGLPTRTPAMRQRRVSEQLGSAQRLLSAGQPQRSYAAVIAPLTLRYPWGTSFQALQRTAVSLVPAGLTVAADGSE